MEISHIREANSEDTGRLIEVFSNSIKTAAVKDYTPNEIKEWLKTTQNKSRWRDLLKEQVVLVAEVRNQVVGFASLKEGNYLDFMYVHSDFMRQGIAQCLLNEVLDRVKSLKMESISSDVSITAKPFFEKNGFKVVRKNENHRGEEGLINYHMTCEVPTA